MNDKIKNTEEENKLNQDLYSIKSDKTDEDFKPQSIEEDKTKQSLTAEEIDTENDNSQANDTQNFSKFKGKEGIELTYSFNGEEVIEGLYIFQKITIYKKNMIYSIILIGTFLMYASNFLNDAANKNLSILLSAISVAILFIIWSLPRSHIKKTAQAADSSNMEFKMTIYDNGVKIGEENGVFAIFYNKEITKIVITQKLFIICVGKERVFILPKRFLSEDQILKTTKIFIDAMEENLLRK